MIHENTEPEEKPKEENAKVQLESPGTMRVFDPFLFLIGNRDAILRIAATPWAFLVGAIFVVSAGIARNYDHHVLTQEWIWIGGPFIASIFTTTFVYIWVRLGIRLGKIKDKRSYLTFLTLVWMTAPCAWLYGIPVESFTDIVTATKWNITFLGIVSLWRVALMVRAISLLTETPPLRASLLVLTPAALEMMVGAWNKGLSIVGIMGGVRLSPQDELLLKATNITATLSFWTFILGAILLFVVKGKAKSPLSRPKAKFPGKAVIPAVCCTLLWFLAAMPYHLKMSNRDQLWSLIYDEEYEKAAAFAASKKRSDFPAAYHIPPGLSWSDLERMALLDQDLPDWLREEWTSNAIEAFKDYNNLYYLMITDEQGSPTGMNPMHPALANGLACYAQELREQASLDGDESQWLEVYDGLMKHKED